MIGRRPFLLQAGAAALAMSARLDAQDLEHQVSEVSGTPRERGRAYGKLFADSLRAFLEREIYGSFVGKPNARETMLRFAAACGRKIQAFSPVVHEEMEGIAEAVGLRLEEVVLLNNHEELWHRGAISAQPHCTVFGAAAPDTAGGTTYVAQTWDWMESVYGMSSILRWKRSEGPSVLAYAYPGLWTGAGVNAKGLALCWHSGGGDGKEPRVGIPAYALIAQMLYQETIEAALEEAKRAGHAGWFVYLLGDAKGNLATVKGTPKKLDIHMDAVANGGRVRPQEGRPVDLARMQLSCMKAKVKSTIDSMVFDCAAREIHVTRRSGGVTPWLRFTL